MQALKNSRTFRAILIVVLLLVIAANVAVSFAYFTDKLTTPTTTLKFGVIKIDANENNWFQTVKSKRSILKPGDVAVDAVSFNLGKDASGNASQPFYVRAKCVVTTSSTNSEVLKISNALQDISASLESNSTYKWSTKDGEYFYLLGSNGQPLAISSVAATPYYFIKSTGLSVPSSITIDGTKANSDKITITISVEAIQKANLVADSGKTLQDKIKSELDALVG